MSSEVRELIQALHDGAIPLEEVAQRFRERTWPSSKPPAPETDLERATAALRDPDPFVPGSSDDVVAAYDRGDLTRDQYRVLAEAVAEAKRAHPSQGG